MANIISTESDGGDVIKMSLSRSSNLINACVVFNTVASCGDDPSYREISPPN